MAEKVLISELNDIYFKTMIIKLSEDAVNNIIDEGKFGDIVTKLRGGEQAKLRRELIAKLANVFERPLSTYLQRELKKDDDSKNLVQWQDDAANKGDGEARKEILSLLTKHVFRYIIKKLKRNWFQFSFTGSNVADNAYKSAFEKLLFSESGKKLVKTSIGFVLSKKLTDLHDIIYEDKKDEPKKGAFKKAVDVKRKIRLRLAGKEKKAYLKVSFITFDLIPELTSLSQKKIMNQIRSTSMDDLSKIIKRHESATSQTDETLLKLVAKIVYEPLKTTINTLFLKSKFLSGDLENFKIMFKTMAESEDFDKLYKQELVGYMRVNNI